MAHFILLTVANFKDPLLSYLEALIKNKEQKGWNLESYSVKMSAEECQSMGMKKVSCHTIKMLEADASILDFGIA